MSLIISACAISDAGNIRSKNEDNFYLNGEIVDCDNHKIASAKSKKLICAVCDGMGGEYAGEIASRIAVQAIDDNIKALDDSDFSVDAIEATIESANSAICDEMSAVGRTMGSTLAMLCFDNGKLIITNIGDSRVYRFSDKTLVQISRDHTKEQFMIDSGLDRDKIDPSFSHILTQHLGIKPSDMVLEPYIVADEAINKDVYLLCSDGLYDMVDDYDIATILYQNDNIENAAKKLVNTAKANGGVDNITVIVLKVQRKLFA